MAVAEDVGKDLDRVADDALGRSRAAVDLGPYVAAGGQGYGVSSAISLLQEHCNRQTGQEFPQVTVVRGASCEHVRPAAGRQIDGGVVPDVDGRQQVFSVTQESPEKTPGHHDEPRPFRTAHEGQHMPLARTPDGERAIVAQGEERRMG